MARWSVPTFAAFAALLLAQSALAQGSACDQLKATLAARIDPSIRGFTLDTVLAATPVPPGAKVIGTCEGGAYKILFRRSGGVPLAAAREPVVSVPVTPPVPVSVPVPVPVPVSAMPSAEAAKPALIVVESAAPSPGPAPEDGPSLAQRVLGFFSRYAYGFAALALVILGSAMWRWFVHRRTYDASGLPRGPRIR